MKVFYLVFLSFYCTVIIANGQHPDTSARHIQMYFNEATIATINHTSLWNRNIYGPMLLVNQETRQVYANEPDSIGSLQKNGSIYTGILPEKINIANTAIYWQGKTWAMIILPLPENKEDRLNLLTHELFHKTQSSLSFVAANPANNHLDKKDGRVYLRLELEAMLQALRAPDISSRKNYLTDAFTFRRYRYLCYPGADTLENALELNEGLAEYTGAVMSGRSKEQMILHFDKSVNEFLQNPTFVRSFAYQTIPIYGYLLYQIQPGWNSQIKNNTNLATYFIKAFNLSLPEDIKTIIAAREAQYNGVAIIAAETKREERIGQQLAAYKQEFVTQPHTELRFEQMSISFDPRNIIPLEEYGTVYTNIRVSDKWGILTVTQGSLVSSSWNKISLGLPDKITDRKVTGKGWELQLADGYHLIKETSGNYSLQQ